MILKTVSRYSGVICSTVSILRIPRSSPQFTVREIKGLSLVLKGFFGVLVPSAIDGTLSDSQFVQELVFEPLVVDDLPHGGQGLFDIGARPRRQVVALQQPLEGAVDPQHLVVDHASTSRRAFSSKVGNAPGSMTWTLKRRPSWAYASSSAMRRASGSRSSSRTSGSGSSWTVLSAGLARMRNSRISAN